VARVSGVDAEPPEIPPVYTVLDHRRSHVPVGRHWSALDHPVESPVGEHLRVVPAGSSLPNGASVRVTAIDDPSPAGADSMAGVHDRAA
jgi:hypothetical protein